MNPHADGPWVSFETLVTLLEASRPARDAEEARR
jgi:hypothetical protein